MEFYYIFDDRLETFPLFTSDKLGYGWVVWHLSTVRYRPGNCSSSFLEPEVSANVSTNVPDFRHYFTITQHITLNNMKIKILLDFSRVAFRHIKHQIIDNWKY